MGSHRTCAKTLGVRQLASGASEQGQPWGSGCSAGLPSGVWGEHEVGGD